MPRIVDCKACGHRISRDARRCPQCGHPQRPTFSIARVIILFILVLLVGYICLHCMASLLLQLLAL